MSIKPLDPTWHFLILYAMLATPVISAIFIVFRPLLIKLPYRIGDSVSYFLMVSSVVCLIIWSLKVGKYLSILWGRSNILIVVALLFVGIIAYMIELYIVAVIVLNVNMQLYG